MFFKNISKEETTRMLSNFGLINVRLCFCLPCKILEKMPHNDPSQVKGKLPYNEELFLQMEMTFLEKGLHLHPENKNVKFFNREIYFHKQIDMLQYIENQDFSYVPIEKDGNDGPHTTATTGTAT